MKNKLWGSYASAPLKVKRATLPSAACVSLPIPGIKTKNVNQWEVGMAPNVSLFREQYAWDYEAWVKPSGRPPPPLQQDEE